MFDFDDCEDLGDYVFTYTAKEVLDREYQKWLKKQKQRVSPWKYREFIISFVKERIDFGYNRFRELEPEWEQLKYHIENVEKDYANGDTVKALEKAIILYDQVLQLFCEGFPLPPNLL